MRYKDLDGEFLKEIKTVLRKNEFMKFDIFIISKVLKKDYMKKKISEETRAEATFLLLRLPVVEICGGANGKKVVWYKRIYIAKTGKHI